MEEKERIRITVETTVPVSPELAWEYWTKPAHITQWNQASEDWHTPWAENDLRAGGKFSSRMEDRQDGFQGGLACFGMDLNRDTPAIVRYINGIIF